MVSNAPSLFEHFKGIEDLRVERTTDHALLDILVIAVCDVNCGANNWVEIEAWGIEELVWLWQFIPTGYPHMTRLDGCSAGSMGRRFKRPF